jgi:hypothetical protein
MDAYKTERMVVALARKQRMQQ